MDINVAKAVILAVQVALVVTLALRLAKGQQQRLLLFGLLTGFLIYSAISTTYQIVPTYLLWSGFAFMIAILIGFAFGKVTFAGIGRVVGEKSQLIFERMNEQRYAFYVLALVIIVKLLKLIYPEVRLNLLLSPPPPNIAVWFVARFNENIPILEKLINYGNILSTPFFYVALYVIRRRLILLFGLIFCIRYIEYVDAAYIARGTVISDLLILFLAIWSEKPKLRPVMLIGALAIMPVGLYLMAEYSAVRLGAIYGGDGVFGGALDTLTQETTFLIQGGLAVIDSGQTIDMPSYLLWIVTLPIPDFVKGTLPVALVNYEISTLIVGKRPGDYGFSVVLTGLLAESYYIFGPIFFWFHGIICGFIAGAFSKIVESSRFYQILAMYLTVIFLHNLNRGGIASTLPEITNGFLAFYIFLFFIPSGRGARDLSPA